MPETRAPEDAYERFYVDIEDPAELSRNLAVLREAQATYEQLRERSLRTAEDLAGKIAALSDAIKAGEEKLEGVREGAHP